MFFVGFSKRLKIMGGMRVGFGKRIDGRRKYARWLIPLSAFVYLMWLMIVGAGWGLYFMLLALYKCYFYIFKGAAWCVKKLYGFIKSKVQKAPGVEEGDI